MCKRIAQVFMGAAVLAAAGGAAAKEFGPDPVAVSSIHGANGPSGSASISGDNRVARYVAFHSFASNLTGGDTNGALDVFLYNRLSRKISRVSVAGPGRPGHGAPVQPGDRGSRERA